MKTFYIIDENGEFYSEDKKVRYKALSGNALHVFLASDQGKEKFFSTDTDSDGNVIGIEIPEKHKAEYEKQRLHSRYLRDVSERYITISYEMSMGEDGDETLDTLICDEEEPDILECLLERNLFKDLKKIFTSLDKEERELLYWLVLSDERMTLRGYADYIGVHYTTVDYRLKEIFEKIKKIFPTN